jgi:nitrite reductase/ring-hydroxylating ferredoxin subunit
VEGLNPARPPAGTVLCRLDEIADPGSRGFHFQAGDKLFLGFVVRRGDSLTGYVDSCPHTGQPLGGPTGRHVTRENDLILCTGHGALFRIGDGLCTSGPCEGKRLTEWPVAVVDGAVLTA